MIRERFWWIMIALVLVAGVPDVAQVLASAALGLLGAWIVAQWIIRALGRMPKP